MTSLYRLVTVDEAKDQLAIIGTEHDARIRRLVWDASQIIINFLQATPAWDYISDGWTESPGEPLMDSAGNPRRVGGQYEPELDSVGDPVIDSNGDVVPAVDSNGDIIYVLDSSGEPVDNGQSIIPGPIRIATFLVIAALDEDREGKRDPISPAVLSVLANYLDPVLG